MGFKTAAMHQILRRRGRTEELDEALQRRARVSRVPDADSLSTLATP